MKEGRLAEILPWQDTARTWTAADDQLYCCSSGRREAEICSPVQLTDTSGEFSLEPCSSAPDLISGDHTARYPVNPVDEGDWRTFNIRARVPTRVPLVKSAQRVEFSDC